MKTAIEDQDWGKLKISTHSIIPTFSTMGINPEFEEVAKSIQALAISLIEGGKGKRVSPKTLLLLREQYLKIETVCAQAAQELQENLRIMDLPLKP